VKKARTSSVQSRECLKFPDDGMKLSVILRAEKTVRSTANKFPDPPRPVN
jgi:hypothetical protein